MIKNLLVLLGLVFVGLAGWPAWADGAAVQRLGTGLATSMAVSADGATLAVGTSLGVWYLSMATLAPLSFWDPGQWVQSAACSASEWPLPARQRRVVNDTTYMAALLAPADLKSLSASPAPRPDCSPAGSRCLAYNLARLVNRDQDTRLGIPLLPTGHPLDAAWSPDANMIYSLAYRAVQAWDAATGKLKQSRTDFFAPAIRRVPALREPDENRRAVNSGRCAAGSGQQSKTKNAPPTTDPVARDIAHEH